MTNYGTEEHPCSVPPPVEGQVPARTFVEGPMQTVAEEMAVASKVWDLLEPLSPKTAYRILHYIEERLQPEYFEAFDEPVPAV